MKWRLCLVTFVFCLAACIPAVAKEMTVIKETRILAEPGNRALPDLGTLGVGDIIEVEDDAEPEFNAGSYWLQVRTGDIEGFVNVSCLEDITTVKQRHEGPMIVTTESQMIVFRDEPEVENVIDPDTIVYVYKDDPIEYGGKLWVRTISDQGSGFVIMDSLEELPDWSLRTKTQLSRTEKSLLYLAVNDLVPSVSDVDIYLHADEEDNYVIQTSHNCAVISGTSMWQGELHSFTVEFLYTLYPNSGSYHTLFFEYDGVSKFGVYFPVMETGKIENAIKDKYEGFIDSKEKPYGWDHFGWSISEILALEESEE